jgi:proline dehydrogenase
MARRAARAYIAGPELSDALKVSQRLDAAGFASTICYWDGPGDTPARTAAEYSRTLDGIEGRPLDCYVSVKAPALAFDANLFAGVFERARHTGRKIHFDSLAPETADQTFGVLAAALSYGSGGCTLPGRWRRSFQDAERAVEMGASVRVVKGQWPDTQHPETDPSKGFLAVVSRLAGRARHVGVATHDPAVAQDALQLLQWRGTPCELELLFGLPVDHMLPIAQRMGVPVRFYVPYGVAWLPYAIRQVRRNPRILLWMLRDCTVGRGSRLPKLALPLGARLD